MSVLLIQSIRLLPSRTFGDVARSRIFPAHAIPTMAVTEVKVEAVKVGAVKVGAAAPMAAAVATRPIWIVAPLHISCT